MNRQHDLFVTTAELDAAPDLDRASMEKIARLRLAALLSEAQNADRMPWNEQRARVNALLFHNMANWLPEPERDVMRAQFANELQRLNGGDPTSHVETNLPTPDARPANTGAA